MLRSSLDRAFVRYARTGDPRALARVFDGSAQELYRLAWHLLGDRHSAEDLVQQTFVVAIEQARDFDGARRVLPWLCGILTHRALHARRQLRQRTTLAASAGARDAVVDPEAEASAREAAELVAAKVRALPEPYRQVLLLHLVHELSPKEVAEALARTDATVRTQLARGLDLLRKALPVGLTAFAAGQVPPPIALAAVREAVLAHAGSAAAAGGGAVTIAFTGVLAMKKVVLVAAAVLAALSSLLWWGSDPPLPANADTRERVAANAALQHVPASPSPVLPSEVTRTEAPEAVDPVKAGLEVLVLWHDGTPAADIPVRVRPRPLDGEPWLRVARSGDDGIARFSLPPGEANALTGRGASADVELTAGAWQHTTITLDRGIDVRGRVVDLHERPIAGATVWMSVVSRSDDSEAVAVTGLDGAFAIRGAGSDFVVTASAPGHGCAKEAWVGRGEIVLTLRPVPGTVIGTVVDPAGVPVIEARVLLGVTSPSPGGWHKRFFGAISGQDVWPSRFLRTDADGRFRSDGLPPIRWPLWIGAPGFAPSWQEVMVRADGVTEVTVRLAQGAVVRGRITDAAGVGAVGVEVNAWPDLPAPHELVGLGMKALASPPQWARMHTTTDATGSYQLQRVLTGKLSLHAYAPPPSSRRNWGVSGGLARGECEVVEGQTFVWDAALAPEVDPSSQPFHGVLVDEDGRALPNWELRVGDPMDAHNREAPYNSIWAREDGRFRTNPVPPGRYPLFAKPRDPMIGAEIPVGEFDVANCPLRVVVRRADVPTAHIRGRIVPPAEVRAKACFVWVLPTETRDSVRVRCDEQGNFAAGPVRNGRYRLQLEGNAFGEIAMNTIDVVDGRDCEVGTFRVPTPGTLVVRMVDPAGNRVPDVWVTVRSIGDELPSGDLEHRDGIARGNLQAGRWLVHSRDQATMAAVEVDVRAGETTETRLVIPDGVPFSLRVPAAARERGRMRLLWRDASGALVRDSHLYEHEAGKDLPCKAPAGRYTLDAVDPRGEKATASFDLRAGEPPPVVEMPLPAR